MPTSPPTCCPCGGLKRNGRCDRCGTRKESKRTWHKLYSLRVWRDQIQPQFLSENPLCVECGKEGLIVPATVADHIEPHRGNMELFIDTGNLQPLCERHHNSKSAKERISNS